MMKGVQSEGSEFDQSNEWSADDPSTPISVYLEDEHDPMQGNSIDYRVGDLSHPLSNKATVDFNKKKRDQIKKGQDMGDSNDKNQQQGGNNKFVLLAEQTGLHIDPLQVNDQRVDSPKCWNLGGCTIS